MISRDVDGMVESAIKVGTVPEDVDLDQIRRDIHDRLSTYYGTTVEKIKWIKEEQKKRGKLEFVGMLATIGKHHCKMIVSQGCICIRR